MTSSHLEIDGTPFAYEAAQRDRFEQLAGRVRALRASGKLTPEALNHIRKFFRIKNIYHSNAIEGGQLSLGETQLVVQEGMTITCVWQAQS